MINMIKNRPLIMFKTVHVT